MSKFTSLRNYVNRNPFLYVLGGGLFLGFGGGLVFAGHKFTDSYMERRNIRKNKPTGQLKDIIADLGFHKDEPDSNRYVLPIPHA